MTVAAGAHTLEHAFEADRGCVWALCYRMTGSAADADDLVQSTFERALERPPKDTSRPWRGWLVRVATNLARDHLRERKRRGYKGPWLPEPVATDALLEQLGEGAADAEAAARYEPTDTAGRYELLESVSFAFLVALEALSPTQRAVLILRDALEYGGAETAEALDMSEANVRVVHHRARKAMAGYDADRLRPAKALDDAVRSLTERFLACVAARDVDGVAALLAEDALALNDGGGRFAAAGVPVEGREKVARFHVGITKGGATITGVEWVHVNGLPALWMEFDAASLGPKRAPHMLVLPRPGQGGGLSAVFMVLVPEKLGRLRCGGGAAAAG
jgi:RNA polymerase sigma-70 factor (ECF subfamily)